MLEQNKIPTNIVYIKDTISEVDFNNSIVFVDLPSNVLSCDFTNCIIMFINDPGITFNRCKFIKSPFTPIKDSETLLKMYNSFKIEK